jgi:DedD protein
VNRLLDSDDDPPGRGYAGQRSSGHSDPDNADREISLGTPTILGIFFALALVCACFFGFGYAMGRKSAQSAGAPFQATATAGIGSAKPTAGRPAGRSVIAATQPAPDPSPAVLQTATVPIASPSASRKVITPADGMIVGDKPPVSASQPSTSFVVQVAAVSSQDVADILLGSLQKKGYTVAVRHEPQDKLLHVQIGPFPDRKEAEATRQRVLADGFNAIVK